jgi:ribosomal protein S25
MFVLSVSVQISAQERKQTKKERKEAKKAKKEQLKKEQAALFERTKQQIKDTSFVIAAERITFKSGMNFSVTQTLNFLKVYKGEGVLQIAPISSPRLGPNGLGGITMKGQLSQYEITDKGDNIYVKITLKGTLGTAMINISAYGGNNAVADVSGLFSGRAFSMYGPLEHLDDVHIFEGTSY